MSEIGLYQDLRDDLGCFGLSVSVDTLLDDIHNLAIKHSIDTTQIVEKYVAFQKNEGLGEVIDAKTLEKFRTKVFPGAELKVRKPLTTPKQPVRSKNALSERLRQELVSANASEAQTNLLGSYCDMSKSPLLNKRVLAAPHFEAKRHTEAPDRNKTAQESVEVSFSQPSSGKPIASYPSDLVEFSAAEEPVHTSIAVSLLDSDSEQLYMYQLLADKAEALDSWAERVISRTIAAHESELVEVAQQHHHPDTASQSSQGSATLSSFVSSQKAEATAEGESAVQLRPIGSRCTSPSIFAGRVVIHRESMAVQVMATPNSCLERDVFELVDPIGKAPPIEKLRRDNFGVIGIGQSDVASLNMDNIAQYSVHLGQPILFKAVNLTGNHLSAVHQYETPALPICEAPRLEDTGSVTVFCAAGPYVRADSAPDETDILVDLLLQLKNAAPQVAIFTGPFVDTANQKLASSYTERSFQGLFEYILDTIAEFCFHMKCQLVVVASARELLFDPVYPSPAYSMTKMLASASPEKSAWYERIIFAPDPCLIDCGGIRIGVNGVDVLMHLSCEEVSQGLQATEDRITRLCRRLTTLGSFYPMQPPHPDVPMDFGLWSAMSMFEKLPHCFIVPSQLKAFIKDVDGVMFVNPGFATRVSAAGSYGVFRIASTGKENETTSRVTDVQKNSLSSKMEGFIVKL